MDVILTVAFGALITSHSPLPSVVGLLVRFRVVTAADGLVFLPLMRVERFHEEPDCSMAVAYGKVLEGSGNVVLAEL